MITDRHITYYQPEWYSDDGTNIDYGGIPDGLFSFQAFPTREECEEWLENNGYEPGDFCINEYHDDDIEEVALLDGDGDVYPRIEETDDETIVEMIVDEVVLCAGSIDNLHQCRQWDETGDQFMDRVYGLALSKVNDAIGTIEERGDFNFQAYLGTPDTEWYDEARDEAVNIIIGYMTEEYD